MYYRWNLNNFDLNKDEIFNAEEINDKFREAMQKVTNDVGRNFSFATGIIKALILSTLIYLLGSLKDRINTNVQSSDK